MDGDAVSELERLKHRVEALEQAVYTLLKNVGFLEIKVEVPKVILSREPVYVKISDRELYGRIILLVEEGFFDSYRSPSEVAHELHRKGWVPKDFQHIRPALEHLTVLGVLERIRDRRRRAYWVYRKAEDFKPVKKSNDTK
ncbi:MAG: hypothetical protein QXF45_07620 [Candidatus Caldarchaeum sp.]